jgi:hypothetical protein
MYRWTPAEGLDNAASPHPVAKPKNTTVYTVVGTDEHGCSRSVATTVVVREISVLNIRADEYRVGEGERFTLPILASGELHALCGAQCVVRIPSEGITVDNAKLDEATMEWVLSEPLSMVSTRVNEIMTVKGTINADAPDIIPVHVGTNYKDYSSVCLSHSFNDGRIYYNRSGGRVSVDGPTIQTSSTLDNVTASIHTMERGTHVLSVYNLIGDLVTQRVFSSTSDQISVHQVEWSTTDVPAGVYTIVLKSPGFERNTKVVVY